MNHLNNFPASDDAEVAPGRRTALARLGATGLGLLLPSLICAENLSASAQSFDHPMPPMPDDGPRPRVLMIVHPKMILLDLAGPMTILKVAGFDIDLVGKTLTPVDTDIGVPVQPAYTFAGYDRIADILFVPGGLMGTIDAMRDEATLSFLAAQGQRVRWVTSVCTGSLLLGAAGLLRGYRATAHWGVRDLLPRLGATIDSARVVRDRNRITGGGATAGLDFALVLVDEIKGRAVAERAELILEYAPTPPFSVGTPELAGPERTRQARARRVHMDAMTAHAVELARSRLRL